LATTTIDGGDSDRTAAPATGTVCEGSTHG